MQKTHLYKRCLRAIALVLVMALPAVSLAESFKVVVGGALNLRKEPSTAASVLGQYPTGTWMTILEEGDGWTKVEVAGKTGYVMSKYLTEGASNGTLYVKTNTGIGLNLREEPDMKGTIITSVKNGETVTVLQKGKTWSRVSASGQEGFMSTQFLRFGSQSASTPTGKVAVVNNPRDTQVLNLRASASLDAKVVDYYRNGVKVTILKAGSTWHKVQVEDGKIGYMMAKFLKVTDETSPMKPFQAKVINVNGGSYVNLRKGASLSAGIIDRIDVGTSLTVIEHGTDWCKVIVDGVEGYMSTWFLAI